MTRRDLTCVYEPFGDAFCFRTERLSERYENDQRAREQSGFDESTYKYKLDMLESKSSEVRLSYHTLARLLSKQYTLGAPISSFFPLIHDLVFFLSDTLETHD
jgi:hypothetical protein